MVNPVRGVVRSGFPHVKKVGETPVSSLVSKGFADSRPGPVRPGVRGLKIRPALGEKSERYSLQRTVQHAENRLFLSVT
jgi:hypothetical protein